MSFHNYHLAIEEGESFAQYQQRRLEVLRGAKASHFYEAMLDVIETQSRHYKDLCFQSVDDTEANGHRKAAKVLDEIYDVLVKQSTILRDAEEKKQAVALKSQVKLNRAAELRVKDKARALATSGSRKSHPAFHPGR